MLWLTNSNMVGRCGIVGDCKIGLLRNRHVLMRFELVEGFINILMKNAYYGYV